MGVVAPGEKKWSENGEGQFKLGKIT